MKEYIKHVRTAYPDYHVEVQTRIAREYVAAHWIVTGKNVEDNVSISACAINMMHFVAGKVAEEWAW